ncbi:MAG: FAD binding domain-containing protein [Thermoleophilia bacterium]|nr:FAD binding domain-containing protein [Thermoleophilia bacterium]
MRSFEHVNAVSVEQAVSILRKHGSQARVIAGGTDLLGEMKDAILPPDDYPRVVVNIKTIPGLEGVTATDEGLVIGALTRLEDLARHEVVRRDYPALAEAARLTASPHIREMGTVGGNICQSNRCWYYWVKDNLFECLRKGGRACYAITGDARYHSIFGAVRVESTACSRACPNGVNIPSYLEKIRQGDLLDAVQTLLEDNPLPAITGRVCPHWCESECARGEFDEALAVREIERFVGDYALEQADQFYKPPAAESGKGVAIVGAGPAGLTAACYLRRAGHAVVVFDRNSEAGGLLAYGIPPYRLPRDVVRRQVDALASMGIEMVLGKEIDQSALAELSSSYDAVLVAAGASQESDLGVPGEECLVSGGQFLRDVCSGSVELTGKVVGVIGGGNTAIDVARSLLRVGAQPVVFYRRTKAEMPALEEEVERAEEEGVRFEYLTQPVAARQVDGGVELTCCRMQLGELDETGRPRPVPIAGSEFAVRLDMVVKASGERPDYSFLPSEFVKDKSLVEHATEGGYLGGRLFVAGDYVSGPGTVAQAMRSGREAAMAIRQFLGGAGDELYGAQEAPECALGERFDESCLAPAARVAVPELSPSERLASLTTEERATLEQGAVRQEANRCFNCGCVAVNSSDLAPALIALGAKIRTSERVLEAEEFFAAGVNTSTVLRSGELVLAVEVPRPRPGTTSCFLKFALRKSIDFPIVNCAAALSVADGKVVDARICLNSVFGVPLRLPQAERSLVGRAVDEEAAAQAADTAVEGAFSLPGNKYKVQIARTLVKRAILACAGRL